jgi:hypothetical protein
VRDLHSGNSRKKILFIGGSINQTTQMHQVARELPDCEHSFTPCYVDGFLELCRPLGLLDCSVAGNMLRARCESYLRDHELTLDPHGRRGGYDLVVMSSDLVVPANIRRRHRRGVVLVQEGILDPAGLPFQICRRLPFVPRWLAGTSTTGLSHAYERFCVASEGYRDLFIANGVPADRLAVTGIPNFDNCRRFLDNGFPHRGFVLVCSSDARETFKRDDRRAFIGRCVEIAAGRQLVFKLHPNENAVRATAEIAAWAPGALVYTSGCAEEMIANCDVLITQYSSTVFVGLALGKEVHSYFDLADLRRLMPLQHGTAAANIAAVCREVLAAEAPAPAAAVRPWWALPPELAGWRAR